MHYLDSAHAVRVLIDAWILMLCPIHIFRSGPPRSPRLSSRSRCTPPSPSTRYGGARSDAQPFPGAAGGEGGRVLPAHRPPSSQLARCPSAPSHLILPVTIFGDYVAPAGPRETCDHRNGNSGTPGTNSRLVFFLLLLILLFVGRFSSVSSVY